MPVAPYVLMQGLQENCYCSYLVWHAKSLAKLQIASRNSKAPRRSEKKEMRLWNNWSRGAYAKNVESNTSMKLSCQNLLSTRSLPPLGQYGTNTVNNFKSCKKCHDHFCPWPQRRLSKTYTTDVLSFLQTTLPHRFLVSHRSFKWKSSTSTKQTSRQ